ncbi:MAG: hypothetical protein U1F43_11835 [Myxococcota bacterium]
MKLSVARLLSDSLRLELPRKAGGEPQTVQLERGVNVRGTLEIDPYATRLDRVAADVLDAQTLTWHFGARPLVSEAVTTQNVAIDLRIPTDAESAIGSVAVRDLAARTTTFTMDARTKLSVAHLGMHEATLRFIRDGHMLELGSLDLGKGELTLGGTSVCWESISGRGLRVRHDDESGLAIQAGELTVAGLSMSLDLRKRGADASGETASTSPSAAAPGANDWHFLDGVSGQVDIDLTVAAKVPVIKRREATHKFRIPIDDGAINFHAAERNLSFLEDAILDFEVEDGRLILEKDIPLLAKAEKVIVYWPLDVDARALAKEERVRLRTLVDLRHPTRPAAAPAPDPEADPKEASFRILAIDADPIAIQLSLAAAGPTPFLGGTLTFGSAGRPAIGRLDIDGSLHYRAEGESPAEPGLVHARLSDIAIAGRGLRIGDLTLSGAIEGSVDVHANADSIRPQRLRIEASALKLVEASLTRPG